MTQVTSPPELRIEVERRLADGRDTDFVRGLLADSCGDALLLTPDARDLMIDNRFRARRRAWRLEHPHARHELLLVRGVRAGHVLVDESATTVCIVDLAIRVGLRGLGIGTDLLAELATDADHTGRTVRVRVPGGNHGARRFFARCGFGVDEMRSGHHELSRPPVG